MPVSWKVVHRNVDGRRRRRQSAAVLLLLLPCAGTLAARQPQTCGWAPWPDETVRPASVTALLARPTSVAAVTAAGAKLDRWFGGCDEGAARQAALDLRNALERNRRDPVVRALLGVALVRGPEVQIPGAPGYLLRQTYQFSNSERDGRRLLAAVARETGWPEIALELAAVALGTRHPATLADALATLRFVTQKTDSVGSLWLARAELALALREYEDARTAGARAVELGESGGVRAMGVALLLAGKDPNEGGRLYLEGLNTEDGAVLQRYYEDILPLLAPEEVAEWRQQGVHATGEWLRREWEWRASTAGRTAAERLGEHHRRLQHALQAYPRTAYRGARPEGALPRDPNTLLLPFDDRGLIYIRHGEPDAVIHAPASRAGPIRVAWAYRGLDMGRAVFEFQKRAGYGDYVLGEPLRCEPALYLFGVGGLAGEVLLERWAAHLARTNDAGAAGERGSPAEARTSITRGERGRPAPRAPAGPPPEVKGSFQDVENAYLDYGTSLGAYDPALALQAMRCFALVNRARRNPAAAADVADELRFVALAELQRMAIAKRTATTALRTENALPKYRSTPRALLSLYALRSGGGTELVAWLGVPGGDLSPATSNGAARYDLRIGLAVERPQTRSVTRADTTLRFEAPAPLAGDALVRTALSLQSAPGDAATVRVMLENRNDATQGQVLTAVRDIPAFGSALALSDLVIAEPRDGTWRRGAVRIAPRPGHQVASGSTFRLFHEVYGLRSDDPLRIRLTITPGEGRDLLDRLADLVSRRSAMSLSFDDTAIVDADGAARVLLDVGAELEPGSYHLEVVVENGRTGERAVRSTELLVLQHP